MRKRTLFDELEACIDAVLDVQALMPGPVQEKLREAVGKLEDAQDILEGLQDGD